MSTAKLPPRLKGLVGDSELDLMRIVVKRCQLYRDYLEARYGKSWRLALQRAGSESGVASECRWWDCSVNWSKTPCFQSHEKPSIKRLARVIGCLMASCSTIERLFPEVLAFKAGDVLQSKSAARRVQRSRRSLDRLGVSIY